MRTAAWIIGAILIVLGIVGLIFGEYMFLDREAVIDLAPLKFRAPEGSTVPLPPLIAAGLLILGVVLMTVGLADAGLPKRTRPR